MKSVSLRNVYIGKRSNFKDRWDYVIMITACWNVFMLPISIAFKIHDSTIHLVNAIADVAFVLDILFMFRTTILNENLVEIRDSKKIARAYLKGNFMIDLLSTTPFDFIALIFIEAE